MAFWVFCGLALIPSDVTCIPNNFPSSTTQIEHFFGISASCFIAFNFETFLPRGPPGDSSRLCFCKTYVFHICFLVPSYWLMKVESTNLLTEIDGTFVGIKEALYLKPMTASTLQNWVRGYTVGLPLHPAVLPHGSPIASPSVFAFLLEGVVGYARLRDPTYKMLWTGLLSDPSFPKTYFPIKCPQCFATTSPAKNASMSFLAVCFVRPAWTSEGRSFLKHLCNPWLHGMEPSSTYNAALPDTIPLRPLLIRGLAYFSLEDKDSDHVGLP
ncbi:hypothetical protein Tco_1094836 [Tanacetum coccineum]|uniref:Uncharacterized protein n=1 Tax=Tanacetum coccineum TaxID=301880 RepID=A0ABQ5IGP2_9ASTR